MKSSGVKSGALLSLCLLICGLAPPAPSIAQEPEPTRNPTTMPPDIPGLPGGFLVVNEDDVQILVEGMESDLRHAQEENAAGRSGAAAKSLFKAAAAVRLEMSRVPHADRPPLLAASDSVVALAVSLRNGRPTSPESIQRVAGLAQAVVAQNLLKLAELAWNGHDYPSTGEELAAALEHFAAAADWSHGGIAAAAADRYARWVQLATMLRQGQTGWTEDEVGSALAEFGKELGRVRP